MRDFTSRHACLEVKFGFRKVQACFIGGSLPVILSSMFITEKSSLINKRKKKIFNFLKIFYPTLVRALHPHGQGLGSIPAGGPVVDYELLSTVPGMNFNMCIKKYEAPIVVGTFLSEKNINISTQVLCLS